MLARILAVLVVLALSACKNTSSAPPPEAVTETDLASDPGLVVQPGQSVVLYLEPMDAASSEPDTEGLGMDGYRFAVDAESLVFYSLDSLDMSGTIGRVEIADGSGNVKLSLSPASPYATATLPKGVYEVSVYSGYTTATGGTAAGRPVYVYSVPVGQDPTATGPQYASVQVFSGTRCEACSLGGADLSDASLVMNTLAFADLSGANLRDSDLSEANLMGVKLVGADLTRASFRGADLSFADLTGATITGADFTSAKMDWAIWTNGALGAPVETRAGAAAVAASASTCSGQLSPGSRWCDQGNGTVKDMTTNFVYLKDPWCWTLTDYAEAEEKVSKLGNGQCRLTDGSAAGDWKIPDPDLLRVLRVGPENLSGDRTYYFDDLPLTLRTYWSSLGTGGLYSSHFTVSLWGAAGEGFTSNGLGARVLPVKVWTPVVGPGIPQVSRGIAMTPGHAKGKYLTANRWLIVANATYVVLWDWDQGSTDNRFWYFEPDGTGYFRIFDKVGSEAWRYLAVYGDRRDAGVDVIAYPDRGGNNHLWKPIQQPGWPAHVFAFQSKSSGMCLDVRAGGAANGSALVQYPCDFSKGSQQWALWFR